MANNVCGKCKNWRKERYWNDQFPSVKHHFFKILLGDYENELRFPRKFMNEFKGELLSEVNLRGPSGNVWTTKLVREEDDVFLRHGWNGFVKDHGLNEKDFLVFGDKISNSDIFSSSEQCSEELSDELENSEEDQEDQTPFSGKESIGGNWSNKGYRILRLISSRRCITSDEVRGVMNKAKEHSESLKNILPYFPIAMKQSHVSHGFTLTIPKKFADRYLPNKRQVIELRLTPPGEKTWEVQFNRWKNQCALNKGWVDFVVDNNLEEGDVCVLALPPAAGRNLVLNVSIFRVVEDIVPLKVQ